MTDPAQPSADLYFKKRINYHFRGHSFVFDVGHTLFSSFDVDEGTDVFLRFLVPGEPSRILDLGCGYGPLGIILAKLYPEARVLLADKDLLAVRYARANALYNAVPNVAVIGSVAMESVPDEPWDLIVSNIPAKIGDIAIEQEFILTPLNRLRPGGDLWFVVVSGLNHLIPRIGRAHHLQMKEVKKRAGHSVYHVHKPAEIDGAARQ